MLLALLQLSLSVDTAAQCNPSVFSGPAGYAADREPRTVVVAEFNGDGKSDLAVANFRSNNVSILLGDGFGGFGPPANFSVEPEPAIVTAGDFNKDGKTDLAVGYFFFRPISVLLGNGNGTFSGPTTVGNSANTSDLAVADFNNDGNPDIAVAGLSGQFILLGNGAGGFTANSISGIGPSTSVAAGDLNGDGIQDAAFTPNSPDWKVAIVLGNAAGAFSVNSSFTVSQSPTAIAIGNFNADSQPDLLVTGDWSEPRVMLFLNQGSNNFSLSTQFFAGREPHDVVAGDFNGDGKVDAVASLTGANGIMIALGDGLGGLSTPQFFGAGRRPSSIGSGDFNADGKLDLVTTDDPADALAPTATGGVSVLVGTGTGSFQSYRSYVYPFTSQFVLSPIAIAVGDFNNNNRPDLALSFGAPFIAIMLDDGQGEFIQPTSFISTNVTVPSVAIADLNGDNNADLITANSNTSSISVYFGLGNGLFQVPAAIAVNSSPRFVGIGDFNGDGKRDLIVTHQSPANAVVLLGDGAGNFAQPAGFVQPAVHEIAIGDFNGDGRSDIAAGNSPNDNVAIFLANNSGHLILSSTTPSISLSTEMRLQTADLNADNKLDVVVANVDRNTVTVFRGDGLGGLSAGTNFDAGPRPVDPTIADFDGNGTLDVAIANGSSIVSLFSGNGAGSLNSPVAYPASAVPNGLAKGDFNQDNKPDLAVLSGTAFGVSILKNVTASLPCFSVNDVTVTEGDSGSINLNFVITLSAASSQTVRVNYSLVGDTATKGADFANVSDRLAFAPGETTKTISVPILGDVLDEVNETFKLKLGSASGATILDGEGLGTILDNDALPSISINDIAHEEAGLLRNFTVTLSAVSGSDVKVDFTTANGTAVAGTSDSGADYFATSGTLTIPAGQSSGQISVSVFDDATFEPTENYFVNLSNPVNATISDAQGISTIINNDPLPTVNILDAFAVEGNSGTTDASFLVLLSNPSFQTVTINFTTVNDSAVAGSDYVAASGQLTFAPGETEKSIVVSFIGDTVDETSERFFVDITDAQNASIGTSRASGIIIDNDGPTVQINDVVVAEGNSGTRLATFTLTLSAPSVEVVVVRATTAPGTATLGSDFSGSNLNVVFQPGVVTRTFNVVILGDTNPEADETVFVNLSNPSGTTIVDSQGLATIIDDETLRLGVEQSGPNPPQAIAFDSLLFTRDPFHVRSIAIWYTFLPDPNTRLLILAAGLDASTPASGVVVNLVDSNSQNFDITAESVSATSASGFTQVVFRLPDGLAPGVCRVMIKANGQTSNFGNITIAP